MKYAHYQCNILQLIGLLHGSYCLYRKPPGSNSPKWFKFDDGDVSEAKIEDEEVGV